MNMRKYSVQIVRLLANINLVLAKVDRVLGPFDLSHNSASPFVSTVEHMEVGHSPRIATFRGTRSRFRSRNPYCNLRSPTRKAPGHFQFLSGWPMEFRLDRARSVPQPRQRSMIKICSLRFQCGA